MGWSDGQSLLLALALLLVLALGWFLMRRRADSTGTDTPSADTVRRDTAAPAAPVTPAEPAPVAEPELPVEPVAVQPEPVAAEPEAAGTEPTPDPVAEPQSEPVVIPEQRSEPVAETTPESVPATVAADDDLRRIQGIGPKMAVALQEAGIRTYQQLADTDVETLRTTVRAAGLRAVPALATWPGQARALVDARAGAARPGEVNGSHTPVS